MSPQPNLETVVLDADKISIDHVTLPECHHHHLSLSITQLLWEHAEDREEEGGNADSLHLHSIAELWQQHFCNAMRVQLSSI